MARTLEITVSAGSIHGKEGTCGGRVRIGQLLRGMTERLRPMIGVDDAEAHFVGLRIGRGPFAGK